MATSFKLPELGENVDSGTITSVLVNVGDSVSIDQPLLELETDKAVVEVPSGIAGVIKELQVAEGEELSVGQVIIVVDESGDDAAAADEKNEEDAQEPEEEPAPEPESESKAKEEPAEVEAPEPPKQESKPAPSETAEKSAPKKESVQQNRKPVRAAPSVRKLARELGVDLYEVDPADPNRGVTVEDVKAYTKRAMQTGGAGSPAAVGAAPLPNFEKWGGIRREAMSKVRQVTMESMTRSWTTVPHVTQNDKADTTELETFRKAYGDAAQAAGGKLTATAILVKVLAEALKRFPQFNSSIDPANAEIIFKEYYNIGIAVDTEHGLMVPSIKNVDQKGLVDIAVELTELSERARTRKITLDELQGACITITNLGGIGGTSFTPIVNAPEVAILGVSRSRMEPVYIDGEFQPRLMMPMSLSYDHRIIDGANAARFTRWICEALEHPMLLMMDA